MFEAKVVPFPDVEEYTSVQHALDEFINSDYGLMDFVGAPVWFCHDGEREHREAGTVTSRYFDENKNLCCRVHLKFNPEGICAAGLIDDMGYKEVSLHHGTNIYKNGTYDKYPIEVSICKKGRRNSPITHWMNHSQLETSLANGSLPDDDNFHPIKATQRAYQYAGRKMPDTDFLFPIEQQQPAFFGISMASSTTTTTKSAPVVESAIAAVERLKFDRFMLSDGRTMFVTMRNRIV